VSRAIVELLGGRLTAASAGRGHGATFVVRLPVGAEAPYPDTAAAPDSETPAVADADLAAAAPAPPPPAPGRGLRLLLVEDHADTAVAMADLLALLGHQVTIAGSVGAAREAAAAGRFDLLVSDLGLPDGSGNDLMRELAGRYGLRGIALSGYGMEEDVRQSLEAGFRRHLTKPVTLQTLAAAVREVAGEEG